MIIQHARMTSPYTKSALQTYKFGKRAI
ncbi:uncharacterized protein METZ01_LOCUS158048 [marine metagenome]|uniref:Uncharacterized protein n=1 Tax=marine metagenome TaxID=408172 RepID=A0A382AV09_9ZZZZ